MSYTYTHAFQDTPAATGHTTQFVNTTGTNVGTPIATGFVELGGGYYTWTGTIPTGHQGAIKIIRAGTVIAAGAINPQDAENQDVATSTRVAAGGTITYTGPVAQTGNIVITRGDDYSATDGRALEWTTTDAATWPDLTNALPVTLTTSPVAGGALTKAAAIITATGATKKVRVELTATDTTLAVGTHKYDLQATLASGRKVTLARGDFTVRQDITA